MKEKQIGSGDYENGFYILKRLIYAVLFLYFFLQVKFLRIPVAIKLNYAIIAKTYLNEFRDIFILTCAGDSFMLIWADANILWKQQSLACSSCKENTSPLHIKMHFI